MYTHTMQQSISTYILHDICIEVKRTEESTYMAKWEVQAKSVTVTKEQSTPPRDLGALSFGFSTLPRRAEGAAGLERGDGWSLERVTERNQLPSQ